MRRYHPDVGREADTAGDGRAELTGVPGEWQLYVVEPGA